MSLATRLTALILLALLPPLAVQVWGEGQLRAAREAAIRREALVQSRTVEASVAQLVDGVRHLLAALSEVPAIRAGDHDGCSAYLAAVAGQFTSYSLLGATDPSGSIACTSIGAPRGTFTNAGRAYFQRAMAQHGFASGDLVTGVSTHRRSIHFALPYRQPDGADGGIVVASVDQTAIAAQLASLPLPAGALAMLIDQGGTVVAAAENGQPIVDGRVGQRVGAELATILATRTPEPVLARGMLGNLRMFGALPVSPELAGLRVIVGLDQGRAASDLSAGFRQDLAAILLGGALAILAGVVGARRFVIAPLLRLATAADRVGAGELGAQAGLVTRGREIREVGDAFNRMSAALAAREEQREQAEAARRDGEERLRASETELRQVADALPFLVAFVDRTLTYKFANATYAWWVDRSPEEVVGLTMRDIAGEEFFEVRRPAIERALAGQPAQLDVDWPWPDGRRRVTDIHYLPRKTLNGGVDGFYITVQDVTALRDATALLAERADTLAHEVAARTAELDRAWRLSQELLVIARPDGTLDEVNPLWTNLLGWTERELIGSTFVDYTHPDDLAATLDAFASVFGKPLTTPHAYRFRHRDGSYRWFSWTAAFEDGRIYASGRDVTLEREQAEALRQSQKMEAVGQLTGGLAHDFNNLLAGISGALELMGVRISQGRIKDVEKYMVAAQGAARRAAALTHRLLAFSRRQTLAPKPTEVNALVNGMLELIQRTVGPDVSVDVVTVAGLWPALVDAPQLENALLNLCINARDAMPGGGRITIETANRWIDRHGAKQHDVAEGQYLSLCVSDTGMGMTPEVVAKAFDPFFTTKPLGEGTGLGLSMIYGFAKQSGGQARIYSEVGAGTMVCIYLPRHMGEAVADASGPDAGARTLAEVGETVLIVDDEPTVRMLVTDVLEDLGYTAIEAADGAAGLRVLQSDVRIDLLVTDVGLPGGMNGRQMADAARVQRPELRVLFITGYAENALLNNGQLEPGMAVLTKPFAVDTLAARMRELIAT